MKIIEIIPQLNQGGAERFVIDLCNELTKHHDVTLIILHSIEKDNQFYSEISPDIQIISMNKKKGGDYRLFYRLYKLIKKISPDIVHTHLRGIVYALLSYLLLPNKPKFIHTVHNDAPKEAGGKISKWCRFFAFKTQRVHPVTISEESQKSFSNFYHLTSTLIYNGRLPYNEKTDITNIQNELSNLKGRKNAKIITNVARIQEQKNQITLAKAIINLNEQGYPFDLFIIGNKTDKKIAKQIENLKSPFIHILGNRDNPRDYMRASDAFCLSSIYEGMPITLIECFSVGAIPICTPVGGVVNMIQHQQNGLLTEGTSQQNLEKALIQFYQLDNKSYKNMQILSKQSFQYYTLETCSQRYINLMHSLLNKNK